MNTLWGIDIPNWIGSLGGLASAGVAIVAFVLSIRNKRSVASVKEALEPDARPLAEEQPTQAPAAGSDPEVPNRSEPEGGDIGDIVAHGYIAGPNPAPEEPWSLMRSHIARGPEPDITIGNASDRTLTLIGISLFNGTQWISSELARQIPIGPREGTAFDFKTMGGREQNVNVIRLTWLEGDGSIHSQNVLV